ncbi:MAG: 50S ribosomal protein L15 [Candidatus Promineifilaceae bacterium]
MQLHDLRPNPGSKKQRKRVGRGIAAGQGKSAGRGTKGQGARSGGGKGPYFEGGQLPLVRRLPLKRGFTNINKIVYTPVNLASLEGLAAGAEVGPELLAASGLLKRAGDPVVILGEGEVTVALMVRAHRFSKSAKAKIEMAGGTAEVIALD